MSVDVLLLLRDDHGVYRILAFSGHHPRKVTRSEAILKNFDLSIRGSGTLLHFRLSWSGGNRNIWYVIWLPLLRILLVDHLLLTYLHVAERTDHVFMVWYSDLMVVMNLLDVLMHRTVILLVLANLIYCEWILLLLGVSIDDLLTEPRMIMCASLLLLGLSSEKLLLLLLLLLLLSFVYLHENATSFRRRLHIYVHLRLLLRSSCLVLLLQVRHFGVVSLILTRGRFHVH